MTDPYRYNCIDKSLLLPVYKKYYVSAYFRLVPQWLTANMITIFSTGFIMVMAVVAFFFESKGSPWHALIFAFCLHTYLLGDHLDGMQAKESGTSSPLGEFLDHYLDVYNGAIVFYAVTVFLGPVPKGLFLVLMLLNCVAFAATMVEELERKELIFGYLGTLEGVLFLNAFFLSWLIPPVRAFWQRDLLWGHPVYWVIIIGLGLGYLGTIADILIRIGRVPKPFALFLICSISFAYLLGHQSMTMASAWLILILFSGDYISRVMNSYLQSKQHQYPDILSMASVFLVLVADLTGRLSADLVLIYFSTLQIWLIFKVLWSFVTTVYQLREHWYWTNPR